MRRLEWIFTCLCLLACSACRGTAEQHARPASEAAATTAPPRRDVPALSRTDAGSEIAARAVGPSAPEPSDAPEPSSAPEPSDAPERREAVVFGSSSVKSSLGRVIEADLERWGFDVTRRGVVSAGLARPDFCDLREVLNTMPIGEETAAVFVYVGMNDGQAIWLRPSERDESGERWLAWQDPRWSEVYTRRARRLFRSICERGAERTIVLLPVAVEQGSLERKMQRIRKLQRRAARDASCATPVSTLGDREAFARDARRLRLRDGFHLTTTGAELVWRRVQERANLLLRAPGLHGSRPDGAPPPSLPR
jgi:hypothetical protein